MNGMTVERRYEDNSNLFFIRLTSLRQGSIQTMKELQRWHCLACRQVHNYCGPYLAFSLATHSA